MGFLFGGGKKSAPAQQPAPAPAEPNVVGEVAAQADRAARVARASATKQKSLLGIIEEEQGKTTTGS